MITCRVESLTERLDELKPLFQPHWEELALDQDKVPLDPQYDTYLARDELSEVLLVTARDNGRLIGYFIGFIAPGLHYKTCLTLVMDIFWIHPDYRGEDSLGKMEEMMLGEELFKLVHVAAKQRGVQRIFAGSKMHKDASLMFMHLGYHEVERYHSLWIGE